MTANEHHDSASKHWLRKPDRGWLLFAGGCLAGVLLWMLVLWVAK